jgi:hypothetical protein
MDIRCNFNFHYQSTCFNGLISFLHLWNIFPDYAFMDLSQMSASQKIFSMFSITAGSYKKNNQEKCIR